MSKNENGCIYISILLFILYINKVLYIFIRNFFMLFTIKRLYIPIMLAKIDNKNKGEGRKNDSD
ncbi:hypothetical protein CON65_18825 [Bacillus pseudomycoides]|uniref:Uncharacterized protein n=1 Tax=Bacillus pseudomycoides TaxID=64104 RepID=A0AA91VA74_9BACI|nr:hypothetical protein COO03_19170 [Bacillus sp. AFS098217]PED81124.1 hypothetical protein CON65_18825 [Bacillus pseudomycoides]PEU11050.1 hypothetical protein CN524_15255 [Bacillus sp. AFS019443]PEU22476.1 hypothetical protein CN525_00205 [Bacillus sp. AFS014408]PFW63428.1 hypothetical protein COL20_08685 [Bacillus sp. AFS075034]